MSAVKRQLEAIDRTRCAWVTILITGAKRSEEGCNRMHLTHIVGAAIIICIGDVARVLSHQFCPEHLIDLGLNLIPRYKESDVLTLL